MNWGEAPKKGNLEKIGKSREKALEKAMQKDGGIHGYKGKGGGKRDFYVDKDTGDIYEMPKGGSGQGEPTGYNVRDLQE